MSPEIVVPFMIFTMPVAIVFLQKYFRFREKQLEAGTGSPKLLDAVRSDQAAKQRELEARIENLESILIALDSDLEARLHAKKNAAALPNAKKPALLPKDPSAE